MPADPELARQYPTRPEAIAAFWALARQLSLELQQLRQLRAYITQRWGRAPRLPRWDTRTEEEGQRWP